MLLKWILCQVDAEQKDAFVSSQTAWAPIQGASGFLGQCGGWGARKEEPEVACILGLWASAEHHEDFLRHGSHDAILARSEQGKSMRSWCTTLFSSLFAMPGLYPDLPTALMHAPAQAFLRVADCTVSALGEPAFHQAQEEVWLPAMREADGMLGGMFSQGASGRFLVTTLWASVEQHQAYVRDLLPACRDRVAKMGGMPDGLHGISFQLESRWTIPRLGISG